jgi:maltokinase
VTKALEDLLAGWIGHQRWFGGKGRPIDRVEVVSDVEIIPGDPGLRHLVIAVEQAGARDRYSLLLGVRAELPDRLKHVHIGSSYYDAAHDADLTGTLLRAMAEGAEIGPLRFRHMDVEDGDGLAIDTTLRSLVLGAEQSNTSLVYGDAYICKLFRRLIPGTNPELEIVTALARRNAPHIARPYGWIETDLDGENTTLAIMQEFLNTASDGWSLALTSVRDLYGYASQPEITAADAGGDFAAESHRLGAATARVHRELAAAFPTGVEEPPEIKRMAERLRRRLDQAIREVPELGEHAETVHAAYDRLADIDHPVPVQRVHGDYHLGQVMRTHAEWVVLDFEGEPGQPLAERRALDSPLRDVAGMLRSFEYAARHLLLDHPDGAILDARAGEWSTRNRTAFMEGYAEAGGEISGDDAALLRALEYAKAVYEVLYEARNRPAWLPIPLAAFFPDIS